jgi:hypothetical protein
LLAYFDNGNSFNTSAYITPHIAQLQGNDTLMESMNINDIVFRRGVDGKTALSGKPNVAWGWQAFISIIGIENIHNKKYIEEEFVVPVLKFFNKFDDLDIKYKYTRKNVFGTNHTTNPPHKLSSALLDDKILTLMLSAYGDEEKHIDLGFLSDIDEIVEMYWEDKDYGKNVMRLANAGEIHE